MNSLIVEKSVKIHAPIAKVWEALTTPESTKKYMEMGAEVISDWRVGSPVIWKGLWENKEMIFVKGEVIEAEPLKHVKFTAFSPLMGLEDVPDNYTDVTYDLAEEDGGTTLEISQGDFAKFTDGGKRCDDTNKTWDGVLARLKVLLEK